MLIGWTGHRPDVFRSAEEARRRVESTSNMLLSRWANVEFLCGGQRGVDTWAADAATARGIPFHIVLPLPPDEFTAGWAGSDIDALVASMHRAVGVDIVCHGSTLGALAYDRRNERLARQAQLMIAVWTGLRQGGTFYTVCAAEAFGTGVESVILPASEGISRAGRGV